MLRKFAISLLTALLFTACGESFDPPMLISNLRVLGISADYPELCPFDEASCKRTENGETTFRPKVGLRALVADENGEIKEPNIEWGICNISLTAAAKKIDCTAPGSFRLLEGNSKYEASASNLDLLLPLFAVMNPEMAVLAPTGIVVSDWRPLFAQAGVTLEELIEFAEGSAGENAIGTARRALFETLVGVKATREKETRLAFKRVKLSFSENPNKNPRIKAITIKPYTEGAEEIARSITDDALKEGEIELSEDSPVELQTGSQYLLRIVMEKDWRQEFTTEGVNGPETLKEDLAIVNYTTAGSFKADITGLRTHNYAVYRTPPVIEGDFREATLFFVSADGRGGQDWKTCRIKIAQNRKAVIRY